MTDRRTAIPVFALVVAVLSSTACGVERKADAHSKESPKKGATPVSVAHAVRQDLAREIEIAAEFRPWQEVDLHAKVAGYLKAIHVDVGDTVRQGQLIAELEIPEMTQELAFASGTVKRTALEVDRARSDVARAETAVRIRKLGYDRLVNVAKSRPNLIAQQEIDDALARYNDAQAQLTSSKAALAAAQEQVHVVTANKERVHTMIQYSRISAPFSGVITQRRGDPGALVQAGTSSSTQAMPVVRLSRVDRLRLVLPLPESVVPRIQIGDPVEIRVDSLGQVLQGRISRFNGRLETATRTMEAEVDMPNPKGALKPGMYGAAVLRLDHRPGTLAVPVQAVSGHGAAATVLVVDENSLLRERKVETGIETPNLIEVLSGLEEKSMVVIGNRSRLKPGTLVEPKVLTTAARSTH